MPIYLWVIVILCSFIQLFEDVVTPKFHISHTDSNTSVFESDPNRCYCRKYNVNVSSYFVHAQCLRL